MTFFAPLSISIIVILGVVVMTTPSNIHAEIICKKTTLYPLTLPPEKPERVTLCHPVGKTLTATNNANIEFNAGIVAAQNNNSIAKCPIGHTKNFCDGWNYQKKWG